MRDCGCVTVYTRNPSILPKIWLPDSIKKWQNTYFYVRNLTEADRIGLPAFSDSRPADKSWSRKPVIDGDLQSVLFARLEKLVEDGLTSRDLTLAWVSRRMYPLQECSHKMCFYSGLRDPTRVTMEIPKQRNLCEWVSRLITDKIDEDWEFGLEPFTRLDRALEVSFHLSICLQFLCPTAARSSRPVT